MTELLQMVCTWCGKSPSGGCEVSFIDECGVTQAFCDYDCYAEWNIAQGYGPDGEVDLEKFFGHEKAKEIRLAIIRALNQYPIGWHEGPPTPYRKEASGEDSGEEK